MFKALAPVALGSRACVRDPIREEAFETDGQDHRSIEGHPAHRLGKQETTRLTSPS